MARAGLLLRMPKAPKSGGGAALVVGLLALALAWWQRARLRGLMMGSPPAPSSAPPSSGPASTSSTAPSSTPPDTLGGRVLQVARELWPTPSTVIQQPAPLWDQILGGRVADLYGGPAWAYFATYVGEKDGKKVSGGTTCAILASYVLSRAGAPAAWINRLPTDPVAPGAGFTPGAHFPKMLNGAKAGGFWLDRPPTLLPGDLYFVDHPPKPNSDHVGLVLERGPLRADGTREITTGDGGQTCASGQCAKIATRILAADGSTLTRDGIAARVLGAIRDPRVIA